MSRTGGAARLPVRRAPILGVLAGAIIVGGLVDRAAGQSTPTQAAVVQPVPVAAPASALSSSWFCAGATDGRFDPAPGTLVLANSGTAAATAAVTLIGSDGQHASTTVQVPARSSATVPESLPSKPAWIGANIDVDAGALAVDQAVAGATGISVTPCATSGSSRWYFTSGQTLINAGVEISLLNPYPSDAIVDLSFTTNQGGEQPQDFQGLDVPGGGMLNVDLGSHLRRRQAIATTIGVRSGSVVAFKTDWVNQPAPGSVLLGTPAAANPLADPAAPIAGVTVTLGAPSAGTTWIWPDGLAGNGIDEQYVIYNPSSQAADVRLSLGLDQGQAEPFDLSVGPGQVLPVVSGQQARIPSGIGHSAVLQSVNGVGVVAARTVAAQPSGPSSRSGLGELLGGRLAAPRWLVPAVLADSQHIAQVVLYNPGSSTITVSLSTFASGQESPLGAVGPITVRPGEKVAVGVAAPAKGSFDGPILATATGPVYVESDFYSTVEGGGISLSFGVPLG
jgi:hypothetical protein